MFDLLPFLSQNLRSTTTCTDRYSHRVDPLSDVIRVAGVRGTVAATLRAGEPWGLRLGQVPGASFHAVAAGVAWLRNPGGGETRLMPGDVVLLPTGAPHGLASSPSGPLEPFDHLAAEQALATGGELKVGSSTAQTRILCATYQTDPDVDHPLLALLPEVLHAPAGPGSGPLHDTLRLISQELAQPRPVPGAAIVLDRLIDVLLVHLLRAWLDVAPAAPAPASWLSALRDPVVSVVLAAIHADPARAWTLDLLAREAAVSRATLARRFPAQVGQTPAAYLTRWRMDLAAQRLRATTDPVASVARSVGYSSEYAFSRAFSRTRGVPPGRWRSHRPTGADPERCLR